LAHSQVHGLQRLAISVRRRADRGRSKPGLLDSETLMVDLAGPANPDRPLVANGVARRQAARDVVCDPMATRRRIPREKTTAALTALLETVCAGGPHADCVTAVYVFGSYARGALAVGDVDTDIEYDAKLNPDVEREMVGQTSTQSKCSSPTRRSRCSP
jgi:hypothetical protein